MAENANISAIASTTTVNGASKNPLQPKNYEIAGTHPDSRILFRDVRILDSTGREPYPGDVLIKGTFAPLLLSFLAPPLYIKCKTKIPP